MRRTTSTTGPAVRATRRALWSLIAIALLAPGAAADGGGDPDQDGDGDGEVIVISDSRRERPRTETTVATEVVTRDQIEESGARNVAELLADHPGLDVVRSLRGSAVRMQGLDPTYVLVLVDGERTLGRVGGALDLESFAVDQIERIEIVKGPSSALFGADALAGVINIITRDAERPVDGELRLTYGSLDSLAVSAGVGLRKGGWRGRTSALTPATR